MNDEPIPLEDEIYEEEIEVEEEPSVMMAMWGEITGDIDNQTDLKEALDAKQDNLTQAQLDAVNSGINSTKVETYDGYQAQINTKASQSALDAEAETRRQADSTLQGNIDAEETARKASDKDIQDVLDGETLARQNADTALGGRIDTEIHDRQVADIALQGQIDAITSKSDVVDVVANYVALQAYDTSSLGNNDVIKVLDDETHEDALTYYRWSTTTQTWTFIGQEAPYYSKSQTDTLLLAKQNTIDSSHKLSADLVDDTSTTNKFVTASDITNWDGKQDALTAGTGIDITGGVISTPAIVPEVVAELPTTGTEGKLYLTPKNYTRGTGTGNPIEATITDEAGQIESFQLDGDTFQQTYTGKNLINPNGLELGNIDTSGNDSPSQKVVRSEFIRVASGNYTLKVNNSSNSINLWRFAIYDSNKTFISADTTQSKETTIAIASDGYIKVSFYNIPWKDLTVQEIVDSQVQLELGSATTYEPFVGGQPSPNPDYPQDINVVTGTQTISINGTNYPISLGSLELCEIGTYKDYIYKDGGDWKVHKEISEVALDGSESWTRVSANSGYRFWTGKATDIKVSIDAVLKANRLGVAQGDTWDNYGISGSYTPTRIYIRDTLFNNMTVGQLQSWLSTHNIIAYYALATATDTTITDTTLIAQLEAIRTASLENGTNTITNTATGTNLAGDMEIGYFGFNPNNRYDKWLWLDLNNNYEQIGGE